MKERIYLEESKEELKEKYQEGIKKLEIGELLEAEKSLLEIVREKPDFVPAYNKLGIISVYRKEFEKAKNWFKQALKLDEEFVPAMTNLGSIKKKEGDLAAAKQLYLQALEFDPEYGPAYNNLGVILREEGNYNESIKYLKKANKLKSYSIDVNKKKSFYQEPGCIVPLIIFLIIIVLYLWLR